VIATSALISWASYLAGEALHVSGVIATVATGLVCGWYQHVLFSADTRMRGTAFWAVLIFLLEASVFMLIGFSLRGVVERVGGFELVIGQMVRPAMLIVVAVVIARFVWVFASDLILAGLHRLGLTRQSPLGPFASIVIGWAGMRGVVTLAVALTLPEAMPGRDFMLVTAFAIILATVTLQGMTLGRLIAWLDVREHAGAGSQMRLSEAEAAIFGAQLRTVEIIAYDRDGALIHPQLLHSYQRKVAVMADYVGREAEVAPNLQAHFDVILAAIAAGRAELVRLHRANAIDDDILHELERDLDLEELGAISAKS
jgi:CPA1 family monovalent cation:H+ antiporter